MLLSLTESSHPVTIRHLLETILLTVMSTAIPLHLPEMLATGTTILRPRLLDVTTGGRLRLLESIATILRRLLGLRVTMMITE